VVVASALCSPWTASQRSSTYIGGEFCPYCAVERWSLILALSHFGTFTGLEYMLSSSTDANPDTPTFTFSNATYTSQYVAFGGVEEFDRLGKTITPLSAEQSALVSQYATCASSGTSVGIPFIDIANGYVVNCGAQFSLPQVAGYNWTQVSSQLDDPSSAIAQRIDGASNTLTAAICRMDGGEPSSVCGQTYATVTLAYGVHLDGGGQTSAAPGAYSSLAVSGQSPSLVTRHKAQVG
jgi:hypothetical protein